MGRIENIRFGSEIGAKEEGILFGYVMINKPELKVKDFDTYQAFYCGVCESLKRRHGLSSGLLLTYDMTFLAVLLSGLYEEERSREGYHRCPVHPVQKKRIVHTEFVDYAADMDLLLSYHNLMDDWYDDRDRKKLLLARSYKKRYHKIASMYPRQRKAIGKYMKKLHQCEEQNEVSIDRAAALTGELLGEIFAYRKDIWEPSLRQMGFFLGKFIYLMDAYEDVESDKKKNNYNPLLSLEGDEDFDERCMNILNLMMAECSLAFERLPIIKYGDILRNILYSGVWIRFAQVRKTRKEGAGEKKK